jgi:mannose-6-phosphate isomerase class I
MYNNYDKYPKIKIENFENQIIKGYGSICNFLKKKLKKQKTIIVIDMYPGVDENEIINGFKELNIDYFFNSNKCALSGKELTEKISDYLTDDRVFGVINHKKLDHYFKPELIKNMKNEINNINEGIILLYGVGAGLITKGDIYIYADIARWEIQNRYKNGMSNWNIENSNDEFKSKYKRGFFFEWRISDRHKKNILNDIDFLLDTNIKENPKLLSGNDFRKGLEQASKKPFRLVPYFDPGVWGGQWMKNVCGLDKNKDNYAWAFDGVPEENSVYLLYENDFIEIPSVDIIYYKPVNLLGNRVHARFGHEFPIRFDFLDTMGGQNLSLQVHPLTEYIQDNFGMKFTQDESYYILDAKEGSEVYLGLKENVNKEEFINDLKTAEKGQKSFPDEKYINRFPVKKHDHFLIPAGTIHCSGKDTMVLEISATPYIFTFKLWDWDRVDLDGKPRPIHIEHGKNVIQWDRNTKWVEKNLINKIENIKNEENYVEEKTGLHEREFLETRRHWFTGPVLHETFDSVNVLNLIEGEEAVVKSIDNSFEPFIVHYAETFIIPASVKKYIIEPTDKTKGKKLATIKAFIKR